MPDINENLESPFLLKISFQKLLEQYEKMAKNKDEYLASKAKQILEVQQKNPILKEGFSDISFIENNLFL